MSLVDVHFVFVDLSSDERRGKIIRFRPGFTDFFASLILIFSFLMAALRLRGTREREEKKMENKNLRLKIISDTSTFLDSPVRKCGIQTPTCPRTVCT
jgi:hypothetical protein